jgi:hypothetical protein
VERICQYCKALRGCPIILSSVPSDTGVELRVDHSKVVTLDNPRHCEFWSPVGQRDKEVRDRTYQMFGHSAIGAIQALPPNSPDVIRLTEKEETEKKMKEDTPNFEAMLQPNMTSSERAKQLLYETDDDGYVLLEDNGQGAQVPRPRMSYQLRNYAVNPDGPIKLPQDSGLFWTGEQVLKHVLKTEIKLGLIIKDPKADETAEQEETEMAGRTIVTRQQVAQPAAQQAPQQVQQAAPALPNKAAQAIAGAGGRVVTPVARTAARPGIAVAARQAPVAQQNAPVQQTPAAPVADPRIDAALAKIQVLEAEVKHIRSENAELKKLVVAGFEELKQAILAHYELANNTGGTYATPELDENNNPTGNVIPLPSYADHPNGILGAFTGDDTTQQGN